MKQQIASKLIILVLFVLVLVAVVMYAVGAIGIWALNTLFGLSIDYGFFEILAVNVILIILRPNNFNFKLIA